jgi:hypothetical protein
MSHKEFVDETGLRWAVWDVRPEAIATQLGHDRPEHHSVGADVAVQTRRAALDFVANELRDGWLAFRSADESRRLNPIPPDWEGLSDHELAQLARQAKPFRRIADSRFEPTRQSL